MPDTDQSIGIAGAAQAFEALLGGEAGKEVPKEERQASEAAPTEEVEAIAGESEGDETAAAPDDESDVEAAPEEDAATDEGDSEEQPDAEPLYTVKINGKEETVTLQEALKGYQRQVDYTRKTEALSHERKSIESERQQVQAERAQYAQMLTALQQQLSQGPAEPDWQKLYDTDPLEYVRQKDLWRERQERVQAAQFEQQRVQALMAQEQAQQIQKVVADGRQKLIEAVPQWKDSKKWDADRVQLLEYGTKLGFTSEELNQTYDPRAVLALYKAMQYDRLVSNKPKPIQSKGPKVAAPGSAASAPRTASEVTRAKQRLANTGKIADAASLFEKLI